MMFLHLGADVVVSLSQVIAILDIKSTRASDASREFLAAAMREKRVTEISGGETKSLVLTPTDVYLSPISSLTLLKRADSSKNNALPELADPSSD